jgi:glycosyltransferase involved in cell wall biosynthesis
MSQPPNGGRKRRVLIIVENLPVPFDKRVWHEATTLVGAGYEVSVICPTGRDGLERHEILDGVHIYRHPMPLEASGAAGYLVEYASALFWELWLSLRIFATRGFDVIQACNPPDLIFLVAAPYKLLGRRFVFDHHDLCPELYVAKTGRRGPLWQLLRLLERLTFALADLVISTNESYRRLAMQRGHKRPEQVFVVRNGPNLKRVRPGPAQETLKGGRRYLVGYVGLIAEQEGIQYLLQAVRHIVHVRGRTDIGFAIVGEGPALAQLRELSHELGVDQFVRFTGHVTDAELFAILNTADVCVNPDEYNELNDKSTMNKIMEYMALGKPIVQFDVTEGRHSAQEASLYARRNDSVDFGEKILELLVDPERRLRMGAIGQARVQHELAWIHQAPKLLAAYETLFSAPERAPATA